MRTILTILVFFSMVCEVLTVKNLLFSRSLVEPEIGFRCSSIILKEFLPNKRGRHLVLVFDIFFMLNNLNIFKKQQI